MSKTLSTSIKPIGSALDELVHSLGIQKKIREYDAVVFWEQAVGDRIACMTTATRIQQGKQLGANYLLSGTLRSIKKEQPRQVRLTKKERIYYSLNLTITDLKTSEVVYENQVEIARESSKPFIGW